MLAASAMLLTSGYRLLSNMDADSGQEVPHFHVHLFGGGPLGPMLLPERAPAA